MLWVAEKSSFFVQFECLRLRFEAVKVNFDFDMANGAGMSQLRGWKTESYLQIKTEKVNEVDESKAEIMFCAENWKVEWEK